MLYIVLCTQIINYYDRDGSVLGDIIISMLKIDSDKYLITYSCKGTIDIAIQLLRLVDRPS